MLSDVTLSDWQDDEPSPGDRGRAGRDRAVGDGGAARRRRVLDGRLVRPTLCVTARAGPLCACPAARRTHRATRSKRRGRSSPPTRPSPTSARLPANVVRHRRVHRRPGRAVRRCGSKDAESLTSLTGTIELARAQPDSARLSATGIWRGESVRRPRLAQAADAVCRRRSAGDARRQGSARHRAASTARPACRRTPSSTASWRSPRRRSAHARMVADRSGAGRRSARSRCPARSPATRSG